ncbi:ABC transporter permease [Tunicatimonas pelagia]|uniref:ABC transporter permease n=1 Tax=Tunicatimonas pelagia TaxID=931531 RepID=UPI00266579EC|nr:ABC transporter permease [Tunicatimonas pelagia]WKN43462.1 ABC transporter permease [Tunicatimonas pelagia]
MTKNYFKIAYRNLLKNKHFSLINIIGLSISLCASLFLGIFILFELSYDNFHERSDDIYRVGAAMYIDGKEQARVPKNLPPLAAALQSSYPEVESFVRLVPLEGSVAIANEDNQSVFNEKKLFFVDSTFFDIFSFSEVSGELSTALQQPNSIVLTRAMAQKYFGNDEVMGKTLVLKEGNMKVPLKITGICEDVPTNSHLAFDFLVSINTLIPLWGEERVNEDWGSWTFYTYLLLKPGSSLQKLEEQLASFTEKEIAPRWPANFAIQNVLQPLPDIHLYSDMVQEIKPNSSIQLIYILGAVALLILLIAWINYTNLTTAKAIDRAREIGVRKVAGADRKQLVQQFIGESVFLNLLGLLLALLLFYLLKPAVHQLIGVPLYLWQDERIWLLILSFFVIGTLGSAFYPALLISSYPISRLTRASFTTPGKGNLLKKALVIFQFTTCLALISATFSIDRQLTFMQKQDLGMDISQMLILPNPDVVDSTFAQKVTFFKQALSRKAGILNVASSTQVPGNAEDLIKGGLRRAESPSEEGANHYSWRISAEFATTYDLRFLAGRNFSEAYGNEQQHVIINRKAADILGFVDAEEAIDKEIRMNQRDQPMTVIGVVDNFNMRSLKAAYDPMVFFLDNEGDFGYYAVKIQAKETDYAAILAEVELTWKEAFPGNPFDYFFLDDYFNAQYSAEERFGNIFGIFALLTIFIACLGLFGLSSIATIQRTKEIGIRKVLGASVQSLLLLLSTEYVYLLLIATAIAIPIANYLITDWLQSFAYRIEVDAWLYLGPVIIILLIALLTISTQTLRAAYQNPVDSLRDE